jgi:hypothetical protein
MLEVRCHACGHIRKVDPTHLPTRYHATAIGAAAASVARRTPVDPILTVPPFAIAIKVDQPVSPRGWAG